MPAHPIATSTRPRRQAASERVRDDDADLEATERPHGVADSPRRAVGIDRQKHGGPRLDVRQIDARVRADEPVARLGDDEVATTAQDPRRLGLGEPALRTGIGRVDRDDAALGLRHDLLGDDHDVARLERCGRGEQFAEPRPGDDLREPLDADDDE